MSICHILISKEQAVDLLGVVDHAAATLQETEPLTLLALDLLEVSDSIFHLIFGHLPEGDA